MTSSKFEVGDRVMAYSHRGEKFGKGTVVKSKDRRLIDYVRVKLDQNNLEIYFFDGNCKRLVKGTRHA